jgi:hypothetical protein
MKKFILLIVIFMGVGQSIMAMGGDDKDYSWINVRHGCCNFECPESDCQNGCFLRICYSMCVAGGASGRTHVPLQQFPLNHMPNHRKE